MNTRIGIDENIMAAIGYIIPIFATIVYFIEQENTFVRFHALQSIILSLFIVLIFTIFSTISCFISFLNIPYINCLCILFLIPIALLFTVLMIFLAYKAYIRESYKVPIIGEYVEKIVFRY